MASQGYTFEVGAGEFQQQVLERSFELPVLVDFWAAWCQPCQMLMPMLATLAEEFEGKFLLAKVNTDSEQDLARQFGVRSLPTVKLFRNGQVVDEFMGVQPESAIRALLDRHIDRASDQVRQQAATLVQQGRHADAIALLREARRTDPGNDRVSIDLASTLLAAGQLDDAAEILGAFPYAQREQDPVCTLLTQLNFVRQAGNEDDGVESLRAQLAEDPGNLQVRNRLAARLVVAGHMEPAMDQYLEIMKRDRDYGEDAGRKGLIDVFRLLGDDDPRVNGYRRRKFAMMH